MWNDRLKDMLKEYVGREIKRDICRGDISFPKAYKGYINDWGLRDDGTGYIEACIVSKRYGNYGEERNWTATHSIIVNVDQYVIESIDVDDRVYGDDGLGDYDPGMVFSYTGYFDQTLRFVRKLLA